MLRLGAENLERLMRENVSAAAAIELVVGLRWIVMHCARDSNGTLRLEAEFIPC